MFFRVAFFSRACFFSRDVFSRACFFEPLPWPWAALALAGPGRSPGAGHPDPWLASLGLSFFGSTTLPLPCHWQSARGGRHQKKHHFFQVCAFTAVPFLSLLRRFVLENSITNPPFPLETEKTSGFLKMALSLRYSFRHQASSIGSVLADRHVTKQSLFAVKCAQKAHGNNQQKLILCERDAAKNVRFHS